MIKKKDMALRQIIEDNKQSIVYFLTVEYTIEGVTAYDTKNNLVLLKIEETGVPLPLADSETVEIGETVSGCPPNVEITT